MQRIFYPQNIVVIGVSERPDNLARTVVENLCHFGYKGKLFAVGRRGGNVQGISIATSLDQVPDGLDLAVILTPAATVPDFMEACGRKGIRRVVIESGGFSEFSQEGRRLEQRLVEIAHRWDMRFVGPNCISVVNLENGVCLPFGDMSAGAARLGPASVVSQSGGVSLTYVDRLCMAGVGVDKAVSIGNKTDLNENDYLEYLLQDPGTKIVCLYLESIGEGRRLMDLARSSKKPIIVHKVNRGEASHRVALSHTAALADDDQIVSAALRQVGIIRAEDFRESVAIAQGLTLPPVRGKKLVVISRSGGHAVIAADAAERYGFQLAPLPDEFTEHVRALFPADVIAVTNPIDLGVIFDFGMYAGIVEECLKMLSPDAVLLINTYTLAEAEGAHRLARRVEEIVRESGRPIAFCVYSQGNESQVVQQHTSLPVFAEIEDAITWASCVPRLEPPASTPHRNSRWHCAYIPRRSTTGVDDIRSAHGASGPCPVPSLRHPCCTFGGRQQPRGSRASCGSTWLSCGSQGACGTTCPQDGHGRRHTGVDGCGGSQT